MNVICRTCGTTLHSEISRDYGQCGACRVAEDAHVTVPEAPDEHARRVSPWHDRSPAPDQLRS